MERSFITWAGLTAAALLVVSANTPAVAQRQVTDDDPADTSEHATLKRAMAEEQYGYQVQRPMGGATNHIQGYDNNGFLPIGNDDAYNWLHTDHIKATAARVYALRTNQTTTGRLANQHPHQNQACFDAYEPYVSRKHVNQIDNLF